VARQGWQRQGRGGKAGPVEALLAEAEQGWQRQGRGGGAGLVQEGLAEAGQGWRPSVLFLSCL
jgi:hypothetical protein